MRRAVAGTLIAIGAVVVVPSTAGSAVPTTVSPALGGCRLIASAEDRTSTASEDTKAVLAGEGLTRLRKVKDARLHRILTHMYEDDSSAKLLAWCSARFTQSRINGA